MYRFKNNVKVKDFPKIVFLCGTKYIKTNQQDKRNVLKKIIAKKTNILPIILEEKFTFSPVKNFLPYCNIYLNNLKDIELLCASLAHKIVIIHDSISTGAEIALFGSNEFIFNKLLVILPDSDLTEIDKFNGFLKLAFKHGDNNLNTLYYYPKTSVYPISTKQKVIYNYFNNGMIKENSYFLTQLFSFLDDKPLNEIKFIKKGTKTIFNKNERIEYNIKEIQDKKIIYIKLSSLILFYQLCSLLNTQITGTKLKQSYTANELVELIQEELFILYLNSIEELEGKRFDEYTINFELIEGVEIKKFIIFSLYCLHAIDYIKISLYETKYSIKITNKAALSSISMIERIPPKLFLGG